MSIQARLVNKANITMLKIDYLIDSLLLVVLTTKTTLNLKRKLVVYTFQLRIKLCIFRLKINKQMIWVSFKIEEKIQLSSTPTVCFF